MHTQAADVPNSHIKTTESSGFHEKGQSQASPLASHSHGTTVELFLHHFHPVPTQPTFKFESQTTLAHVETLAIKNKVLVWDILVRETFCDQWTHPKEL
jgi:hypothetical protein